MYKLGDKVIHRQEGACQIQKFINMKNGRNEDKEYFLLVPLLNSRSFIYISVDADNQKNIRPIIKQDDLRTVEKEIEDNPLEWIDNSKHRFDVLRKCINNFNFKEVALVLESLKTHNDLKRLNNRDGELFLKAKKLIFSEIAALLNVDYDLIVANPAMYFGA